MFVCVRARFALCVFVCSAFMSSPSRATSPSYTRPHSPLTPSPSHHLPHAFMFSPHTFRTLQLILIHSPARPRTLALTEDLVLAPSSSYICPHTLAPTPSLMTPYITLMPSPPCPHILLKPNLTKICICNNNTLITGVKNYFIYVKYLLSIVMHVHA